MLFMASFLSALLLLAVNLIVRWVKDWPLGPVLACCLAGVPCFLTLLMPAVLLQAALLVVLTAAAPRLMDELREAATRKLDTFEVFGLSALLRGDHLFIGAVPGAVRMLGAVRNVKACIDCHGGERGDLLGAFSYTLRAR
jgi:hypothetical protein